VREKVDKTDMGKATMTDDNEEANKAVQAWAESEATDDVADYAMRGRVFANLSESDLSDAWIKAFKGFANDIHNKPLRDLQIDYGAEFRLRGLQPPHHRVEDDLQKMTAGVKKWMEGLTQEQEDDLEHKIETDFDAFQAKRDKEKNLATPSGGP
jgi:hypothetical protein